MTKERKILAWLGVASSVVACFPTACFCGFLSVESVGEIFIPEFATGEFTDAENAFYFLMFGVVALVALIGGLLFFVWGVRTLLSAPTEQAEPTTE